MHCEIRVLWIFANAQSDDFRAEPGLHLVTH
jgi:hypothetical protein